MIRNRRWALRAEGVGRDPKSKDLKASPWNVDPAAMAIWRTMSDASLGPLYASLSESFIRCLTSGSVHALSAPMISIASPNPMDVVISSINSDVEGEAGRSVLEGESKMSIAQLGTIGPTFSSMNTCKVHPHVMRGAMACILTLSASISMTAQSMCWGFY